jgi:peptidyl-tRNA hydrolase, PTH1 family
VAPINVDYCIVGLGNPGLKYFKNRHNIGYMVIDKLAGFFNIDKFNSAENFFYSIADFNDKKILLMKPVTFMNLSGIAVKEFLNNYPLPLENLLIVYDDVNIPFGTIRLRSSGSEGGQNGMGSVIYELETENILRLRIGIRNEEELEKNKNEDSYELAGFVLSDFSDIEMKSLDEIIEFSKNAVLSFVQNGILDTMNNFNKNIL